METQQNITNSRQLLKPGVERPVVIKRERSHLRSMTTVGGLIIGAVLIAYFLLMRALGLHEVLWLRYFNFVIVLAGQFIVFSMYRKKYSPDGIEYMPGLLNGFKMTFMSVWPLALFMFIYLSIDKNFMMYVKEHGEFGSWLTPFNSAIGLLMEGDASGAVITLSLMQFFKNDKSLNR
jgi:hypothetical protein